MDLGADRRGVDMGPSAIRYAGLANELESLGIHCEDGGDLAVPNPQQLEPGDRGPESGRAKYLGATRGVCESLEARVREAVDDGAVPLVVGGDHSIAIGTVNGVGTDENVGVLWFDAHGDFNTPATSPSGNVHGMPLAALLGRGAFADTGWAPAPGLDAENVALVGTRSLDDREREALRESAVSVYTMNDVDSRGITNVVEEATRRVMADTDSVHVSLDLDFLDPNEAPGVGTPARGGSTYREAHTAMELVSRTLGDRLGSLELVEVNPILDEHNRTAELAVELAASVLGKRII
jgi:arginase